MALIHASRSETANLGGRRLPVFFGMGRVAQTCASQHVCEAGESQTSQDDVCATQQSPGGSSRVLAALPAGTDLQPEPQANDEQVEGRAG